MENALHFGAMEIRPRERALLQDGEPIELGARAFDLLLALVHQRDRVMSKRELMDAVWADVVVEEANLHVQISGLRKSLGSDWIVTVPGQGYRFSPQLDPAPAVKGGRPQTGWSHPEMSPAGPHAGGPGRAGRIFLDDCEVWPERRQVWREGVQLELSRRAFDMLMVFIAQRGRVLNTTVLLNLVWPEIVVHESNVYARISELRAALGPHIVSTVPGRGYQLLARAQA